MYMYLFMSHLGALEATVLEPLEATVLEPLEATVLEPPLPHHSSVIWNYCILDEGHIIKNTRTKVGIEELSRERRGMVLECIEAEV